MNLEPDEGFWRRITAYLRFEKRRAKSLPMMLILGVAGIGLIVSGRAELGNPWPYWIAGAICVAALFLVVVVQEPRQS